jgi:hypothetical protein
MLRLICIKKYRHNHAGHTRTSGQGFKKEKEVWIIGKVKWRVGSSRFMITATWESHTKRNGPRLLCVSLFHWPLEYILYGQSWSKGHCQANWGTTLEIYCWNGIFLIFHFFFMIYIFVFFFGKKGEKTREPNNLQKHSIYFFFSLMWVFGSACAHLD